MPEGLENTGSGSDRVESLLPRCLSKEIDGVSEKNLLTLSLFVFLTSPPFGQEVNAFLLNCLCFLLLFRFYVQHFVVLWGRSVKSILLPQKENAL